MSETVALQASDPLEGLAGYPGPLRVGRLAPPEVLRVSRLARRLPLTLSGVIGAWLAYLIAVPILSVAYGPVALLTVPAAGVYLFSWLGFYRHELWHSYFPRVDNRMAFNLVACLLFSDPQVYRAAHSSHHKYVHTTGDLEFYCEDWETNRGRRRRQFVLELLLGNIAWEIATFGRLLKEGRVSREQAGASFLARLLIVSVPGVVLFAGVSPAALPYYGVIYLATIWLGSVVTRHVQFIEHLGILSDGDIVERNLLTRNLSDRGLVHKLVNALSHADAEEHVYHHTDGRLDTRNTDLQLMPEANTITLGGYFRLLREHYRSL